MYKRQLLEQFYAAGLSQSDVEIRLPLGRYVPEFRSANRTGQLPPLASQPSPRSASSRQLSTFLLNVLLALTFTLVGVGLTVAIVRWGLPRGRLRPMRRAFRSLQSAHSII